MRNRVFTALLAVAVVVLTYLLLTRKPEKSIDNGVSEAAREVVKLQVKEVIKYIDKEGFTHAVIKDKDNVVNSLNQLDDSSRFKIDSIKALLNIKDKQLKHYISYSSTLEGRLLEAKKTDTSFRYSDSWANIEYVKPKDTLTYGHFNFKYNAELNYAEYWEKKNFLSSKKHYIDFWINDPRATINGVKRIKISPKPDRFGIEINASSFYTDRINLGFDGAIRVGRGKYGGGYIYDFSDKKWKPLISVKFNLLDL